MRLSCITDDSVVLLLPYWLQCNHNKLHIRLEGSIIEKEKERSLKSKLYKLGIRLPWQEVSLIIQLLDMNYSINSIRWGKANELYFNREIRHSTIDTIKISLRQDKPDKNVRAVLKEHDAVNTINTSRDEATDRVLEQAEVFGGQTLDEKREAQGITDTRQDPHGDVDRLHNFKHAENKVKPEHLTLAPLESIGYDTDEALIFLTELYWLQCTKYNAQVWDNYPEPATRLRYFDGIESLIEKYNEIHGNTQHPPVVLKAITNTIEMPKGYLKVSSKLLAEGVLKGDEALRIASAALLAFAPWRGATHRPMDGSTVLDPLDESAAYFYESTTPVNKYLEAYFKAMRPYSADEIAHNEFIDSINKSILQEVDFTALYDSERTN